ncbi:hypothetical protein SAMN04489759_102555 [Sulfitobacter delicatus]|uniref:Uncharacterized protein n=1 Tax=Sulfitobacter delicatus TaxID=218672 RepID=A0A1G7MGN5_9RHOB|nr:hypothetical protein SAMN04489759_102555 [Sulfitobacter delicatus]
MPLYGAALAIFLRVAPSLTKSPTRGGGQAMARRLRLDSGLGLSIALIVFGWRTALEVVAIGVVAGGFLHF